MTPYELGKEITSNALTERTRSDYQDVFSRFSRWCEAKGLSALPAVEKTVLEYLNELSDNRHAYLRTIRTSIDHAHEKSGYPKPCGVLIKSMLSAKKRSEVQTEANKTTPFTAQDIKRIIGKAQLPKAPKETYWRKLGILFAKYSTDREQLLSALLAQLDSTAQIAIDPQKNVIVLHVGGQRTVLRRDKHPEDCELVENAVKTLGPRISRPSTAPKALKRLEEVRISPNSRVKDLELWQWKLLLQTGDKWALQTLRNKAYLLVGFVTAARHVSLAKLQLEDISPAPNGFRLWFGPVKKSDGFTSTVEHLEKCTDLCPACALREYIDFVVLQHERNAGPAFATYYGKQWREMTYTNINSWLKSMGEVTSTRSLRVGAATGAHARGATLEEISRMLGHKDLATTAVYIRNTASRQELQINWDKLT